MDSAALQAKIDGACTMHRAGFGITFSKPHSKEAAFDGWPTAKDEGEIARYLTAHPDCNALALTRGFCVVDSDMNHYPGQDGIGELREWETENGNLPETWTVITGRGGYQQFYRQREGDNLGNRTNSKGGMIADNDIRANGGYVMCPGSIHPDTGRPYEFEVGLSPDDVELADVDEVVRSLALWGKGADGESQRFTVPDEIPEGTRHDTFLQMACSNRARNFTYKATVAALVEENAERSGKPWTRAEIEALVSDVWRRYPAGASKPSGGEVMRQNADGCYLPPWTAVQSFDPPKRNPVLIDGVVRRGHVALLSGKGKIGKSWSAIELCISVATGRASWFGLPLLSSGACLYIDPELDSKSLDNRFRTVCDAMGADPAQVDERVRRWSLRGIANASMEAIIHDLQARGASDAFALVVIDSCSCFVEGDENKSVDVRAFAAKVLQVASITGATVLLVHHYGKTKDGDRSAADRARGSSVWLDFPDAVLTLTETFPPNGEPSEYLQPGEYACLLESGGVREFPRLDPVRLVFGYPVHRVDVGGITNCWKPASSARSGGRSTGEGNRQKSADRARRCELALAAEFIAGRIGREGIAGTEAAEVCAEFMGETVKPETLKGYLKSGEVFDVDQTSPRRWRAVPKRLPREPQPTLM